MAQQTVLMSAKMAVAAMIDPDVLTAATHTSDWVDMSMYNEVMAVVAVGTLGSGASVDAKLEQATDAAGSGAKDVTGKAITQLTQGGGDSDKQALINCAGEELDVNGSFTHVRLSITVAGASSDGAGIVMGACERYGPANANDLASVAEIVA